MWERLLDLEREAADTGRDDFVAREVLDSRFSGGISGSCSSDFSWVTANKIK